MPDAFALDQLPRAALIEAYRHLERRATEQERRASEQERRASEQERRASEQERRAAALESDNTDLAQQLEWLRKQVFGPRSERSAPVDPDQPSFLDAPVVHDEAPTDEEAAEPETETIEYQRKKPGGRRPVSRELPTEEIVLRACDEERIGPNGERLVSLGFEVTERIHLVPERLLRLVIKREKLGLPDTRELAHTVAPPPSLVPGGKASDAFLHEVVLRKFQQGLPLYRQQALYNAAGADLPDSFLGTCVRAVARAYAPIAAAIRAQVLANTWVHADETPIRQLHAKGATVSTAYLWAWIAGGQASFHYGTTRSRDEVRDVLGIPYDPHDPRAGPAADRDPERWEHGAHIGFLIVDGYTGYDHVFEAGRIERVACWAHVRRKFKALEDVDANARRLVGLINDAFRVDRRARKDADKRQLDDAACAALFHERRQAETVAIIDAIAAELDLIEPHYTPEGAMARAIRYTRGQWDALRVFLEHGFLPMDNNRAERAIRPIAVGRKNWLFIGSEDGGEWAAVLFSIIESCRLQKIDHRRYLEHVTPILATTPADDLDPAALTPRSLRTQLR